METRETLLADMRAAFDGDDVKAMRRQLARGAKEVERLGKRVAKLEARLEIDHAWKLVNGKMVRYEIPPSDRDRFPDGIAARDETIKLLEGKSR